MPANIGIIIKEIRLSKKISSETLYKGVFSRQARSNFEKGISDTTVNKFFIILDRLNLSLEEFYVAFTQNENAELHLFNNIAPVFYGKDIAGLKLLITTLKEEYKKTNNIKYYHYQIMAKCMLNSLNNKAASNDFEILSNYLNNCESWGYYEIMLFSNSINYFSQELIDTVFKRVKNTIINFQKLQRYKNEYSMLLLNIITKSLFEFKYQIAKKYFKEYEKLADILQNDMYYQSMKIYFHEVISIMINKEHPTDELEKIVTIIGYLNMKNKQKQCIDLLKHLKLNVQKNPNNQSVIPFQIKK
ncbi:hypothetical protein ACTHOQ_15190 [Solibacillus silvestris]|uniref:Rgg family transcriptional regulator n=1 Tax=Solibacillus silvestris TaxID=76853 RepID=UPI003F7CE30B